MCIGNFDMNHSNNNNTSNSSNDYWKKVWVEKFQRTIGRDSELSKNENIWTPLLSRFFSENRCHPTKVPIVEVQQFLETVVIKSRTDAAKALHYFYKHVLVSKNHQEALLTVLRRCQ